MKKSTPLIAALLIALGGAAQAQTPATSDEIVQRRAEERVVSKAYSDKKSELDAPRRARMKAAADKAATEASAKGQDPLVARRDAEAKVKSETQAEYDAKLKALRKERDRSLAEIRKKYEAAGAKSGTSK